MGLFHTISEHVRQRRERRRILDRFRQYVDPSMVDDVLKNPECARMPIREGIADFVLLHVVDNDLSRLPESLTNAIDVLRESGAWVDSVCGSLVFATFGVFPGQNIPDPCQHRRAAVTRLHDRLGVRVRIVHGSGAAIVGDITCGSTTTYSHFGSGLQHFGHALTVLMSLGVNEALELTEDR